MTKPGADAHLCSVCGTRTYRRRGINPPDDRCQQCADAGHEPIAARLEPPRHRSKARR